MTEERPRPAYGEERPRPAYGEYATPEQQAAAMGKLYAPPPVTPAVPAPPPPGQGAVALPVQPRRWDLFLTSLLLAYGLWGVISGFVNYADLTTSAQSYFTAQGVGTFTSSHPALGRDIGIAINVADVVIYLIAAVLAWSRLRRGKIAFWILLLAGVVSTIIAAVGIAAYLFTDPNTSTLLTKLGG